MSTNDFTLREIRSSDSDRLAKLITEFEDDLATHFQVNPYQAIVSGTENRTTGVGVERMDEEGFVGMGTVRFSSVQFNDEILPLAFLDGLKVREEFRGHGLGTRIAQWRIQKARAEYGDRCIIGTGMLHDNHASHAVAQKWCSEFVESAFQVFFVPTRGRHPRLPTGITLCEIERGKYQEFAEKQNRFYSQYNLYPPSSPEAIAHARSVSVEGRQPYCYFAVVDAGGNLLAGAQTWARGVLKYDQVNQLPAAMRVLNKVLHLLPPDLTIRDVAVNGLWYAPGREQAGHALWEMMRWVCRDRGNILTAGFDIRDPAARLLTLKPWNQPRPRITYAIHAPMPLNRDRLLYTSGRV